MTPLTPALIATEPAGARLNAWCAERLGWKRQGRHGNNLATLWRDPSRTCWQTDPTTAPPDCPHREAFFSGDVDVALEVLVRLGAEDCEFGLGFDPEQGWEAWLPRGPVGWAPVGEPALAVTRAFLLWRLADGG